MLIGFVICESLDQPRIDLNDELGFRPAVQLAASVVKE
jgi:hypothetical protein